MPSSEAKQPLRLRAVLLNGVKQTQNDPGVFSASFAGSTHGTSFPQMGPVYLVHRMNVKCVVPSVSTNATSSLRSKRAQWLGCKDLKIYVNPSAPCLDPRGPVESNL